MFAAFDRSLVSSDGRFFSAIFKNAALGSMLLISSASLMIFLTWRARCLSSLGCDESSFIPYCFILLPWFTLLYLPPGLRFSKEPTF